MKKNMQLLLMSFLFFITAGGEAQEGCDETLPCYKESCFVEGTNFYAKILSGANFLQNISIGKNKSGYETGYLIGGSLGYCWRYGLCLEGEYAFRRNAIRKIHFFGEGSSKQGHFQTSSYMANLLWHLPLSDWSCACWNIQPFIGAGIGYDLQQMHSSNSQVIFRERWNHFSWQLIAGLAYPIFCNADITLEYKFHEGSTHFYSHLVGVGFIYNFGF